MYALPDALTLVGELEFDAQDCRNVKEQVSAVLLTEAHTTVLTSFCELLVNGRSESTWWTFSQPQLQSTLALRIGEAGSLLFCRKYRYTGGAAACPVELHEHVDGEHSATD
jgi:hypothetical protein